LSFFLGFFVAAVVAVVAVGVVGGVGAELQIRHPEDETQCMTCPLGSLPDSNRTQCEEIPEVYLRADSGWAIGVMSFSSVGIVLTSLVRPESNCHPWHWPGEYFVFICALS